MTDAALIALDQGTTSTRAIAFSPDGTVLAQDQRELAQSYPKPGWVEQDGEEILADAAACVRAVLQRLDAQGVVPLALGITNQRETVLIWDKATGRPIHPAIVWQDRRTAAMCRRLKADGHEPLVTERTGLLLDPYFSATKIAWILEHVDGARARAEAGDLAFGTVDSWLIARLGGGAHLTDITNAARTLLFDIDKAAWDTEMCDLFDIPMALLPEVVPNAHGFGITDPDLVGRAVPITGCAGDQQAASFGQRCFAPGRAKSTYGTGCFVLQNVGERPVRSTHRLLSTIAFDVGGRRDYALEGAIFVAGAAIQWLRDGLGLLTSAAESGPMAGAMAGNDGVYLVPAFTGLGAPHWDPDARGLLCGLSRSTGPAHLARAALESVAYQTVDLMAAFESDSGLALSALAIDGGMALNDWFAQFLADMLARPVDRPAMIETTALGAAMLAGLGHGLFGSLDDLDAMGRADRRFQPDLAPADRDRLLAGWRDALARCLMPGPD